MAHARNKQRRPLIADHYQYIVESEITISKKKKKANISDHYEKSSLEDMEDTKKVGLKSIPKTRKEQVPNTDR